MAAFLQAKSLLQPQSSPYLDQLKGFRARLKAMEAGLSSEILQRWFAEGPALPPTRRVALLCGHARSGTTLLEQVLDAHPDIISADETTVFADDALTPLRGSRRAGCRPADGRCRKPPAFRRCNNRARTISGSSSRPSAALSPAGCCWTKIPCCFIRFRLSSRILPETKFLIALRDPRDVVLSCFMQPQTLNPITAAYLSLAGTVQDYADHMSLWRTLAPLMPGHYLEVRYEDMVADPGIRRAPDAGFSRRALGRQGAGVR